MANEPKKISPNSQALIDALKANPNKAMTLAELAEIAGVEPKSGYLRSVKSELGNSLAIGEVEKVVSRKVTVNTYTYKGE